MKNRVLTTRPAAGRPEARPLDALTMREREVLAQMAQGRSNAAIGQRLGMKPKTLEAHISQILQRLGLPESPDDHRRVLAVLTYLDNID